MIALKKLSLALFCLSMVTTASAQEKGDLGVLITTSNHSKMALEYRNPISEKAHFKIGATFGADNNHFFGYDRIISASDSAIVERKYYNDSFETGLRVGFERRMSTSMFSIGGDLNFNYRQRTNGYNDITFYANENGEWGSDVFNAGFTQFGEGSSRITRHFFVPSARLSFNMNIPLGDSFILSLISAVSMRVPIYMGATNIHDPNQDYIGSPASIIDFDSNFGMGLRYNIGSVKRNK